MAKRKFKLEQSERQDLLGSYRSSQNAATRTRYQAVRLYGEGYPVSQIEEITGCSRSSLMEWCRAYRQDPVQSLEDKRLGGNRAKLEETEIEELQDTLHQYTPRERLGDLSSTTHGQFWAVKDLALLLREKYNVEYKQRASYVTLLHRCGFSYQKTEKVYKNHSQFNIADFEEELEKN
ncbi:MAG: transposase [Anaerolineae bacterium]|jgi:transposase|nr:transposase [Anaerolineae bacterium]MBT7190343.1 transposase [Anaerolineae bacterium]MBT7991748.1 transposase [Anaerolineae bacterium]